MHLAEMADVAKKYAKDGFLSPIDIIGLGEAAEHRARMEAAEAALGGIHYLNKIHTVLRSPYELATHPRVLDMVESLIGPDIMLHNVVYIIKEPSTAAHVSWHQDLTYWGFDGDAQVSMWLALSPATPESGCMRMVPGSHTRGRCEHSLIDDPANVLFQGQTVSGVAEEDAVMCPLRPGQASFHHGWTLHSSFPNTGNDRRIGVNVQYLAPSMRQTKHNQDTAILVRGEDCFGHYGMDKPAEVDLDPAALERRKALDALYQQTAGRE